jgi:purine nucleosidase
MGLYRFPNLRAVAIIVFLVVTSLLTQSQASQSEAQSEDKRKIIIDQDAAGPAGTDQQAILLLIQSPQTEVLGITVVTGDAWLTEEVAHTLRMLEIIGRTDIPVLRGAEYPLVRT